MSTTMTVEQLETLMTLYKKVSDKLAKKELSIKKTTAQKAKIETLVGRKINKEEDGLQNHTFEGVQCYATRSTKYSFHPETGREKLTQWIVQPLQEVLEMDGFEDSDLELIEEALAGIVSRLQVFATARVNKDFLENYRLLTGGVQETSDSKSSYVVGGDLPDGVRTYVEDAPVFRKTKSNQS